LDPEVFKIQNKKKSAECHRFPARSFFSCFCSKTNGTSQKTINKILGRQGPVQDFIYFFGTGAIGFRAKKRKNAPRWEPVTFFIFFLIFHTEVFKIQNKKIYNKKN